MKREHRIWREALTATIRRHGSRASETLLTMWDREVQDIEDERLLAERLHATAHHLGPRREPAGGYSQTPTAIAKRAQRADPVRWLRERDRREEQRREAGSLTREARLILVRQRSEETREARAIARRLRAAEKAEERRAIEREKQRARRAAMTVEARRAEWLRAQHAKRARDRAAREALGAMKRAA
jgi:hypothetical protein